MSNSAFTPSTTTVTNEVPVNVPVVTSFADSVTPSGGWFVTGPTNVTTTVKQARIGTEAHLKYAIIATGTSAAFSELSINLPANLTVDTTSINKTSSGRAPIGKFELTKAGVGNYTGVVYYEGSSFVCRYLGSTAIPSSVGNTGPLNWNTTTSATSINIDILIPIAEWAGSGTTTLATRAVEEYAWNSDTTDSSTTGSGFSNGPSGVSIGSFTTAERSKRVRFQQPILATDIITLEINDGTGWTVGAGAFTYITQSGSRYGILLAQINATDVDVRFSANGARPTNATYGGPGDSWTSFNTYKWRVRKVSSGAQVGYPVSARNIVGDTSGSVVPVGMLGEKLEVLQTSLANCGTANQFKDFGSVTLGPGVWSLSFICMFSQSGSNISVCLAGIGTVAGNSGTGQNQGENAFFGVPPSSATDNTITIPNYVVSISSTTTFYGKVYATYSTGTPQYRGRLTAVRIA